MWENQCSKHQIRGRIEVSSCFWIARWRLAQKECFFHSHVFCDPALVVALPGPANTFNFRGPHRIRSIHKISIWGSQIPYPKTWNATANPLANSSKSPLDKWQSFGKYHWTAKLYWKMPLRSKMISEVSISGVQSMYIYIYIYIYTHTHIHTYTHKIVNIHTHPTPTNI